MAALASVSGSIVSDQEPIDRHTKNGDVAQRNLSKPIHTPPQQQRVH